MNDHDTRIAALEATVAELKRALEAERRERAALPKLLLPNAAETRRMLADLETTLEMNVRAFDVRIAEVAARDPSEGGPPLDPKYARAVANYVREILGRDEWTRMDGDVACLLVISLRLISQLAWAIAEPPEERIAGGISGPQAA